MENEITMYIYKSIGKNGEVYVGKRTLRTLTPEEENYFGSGVKVKQLLDEYGRDYFTKEVLYQATGKYQDLATDFEILEKSFIKKAINQYGDKCINKYIASEGVKMDEATKEKIRKAHLGKHHTQATKDKISKSRKETALRLKHKKLIDSIFEAAK